MWGRLRDYFSPEAYAAMTQKQYRPAPPLGTKETTMENTITITLSMKDAKALTHPAISVFSPEALWLRSALRRAIKAATPVLTLGTKVLHIRTGYYGTVIPRPAGKPECHLGETLVWWMEDGYSLGSVKGRVRGSYASALRTPS